MAPEGLTYAVVEETRAKGRVVKVAARVAFGTIAAVAAALDMSGASTAINTAFAERQDGTDRHRNARKAHRSSKDWRFHEAVTYLALYAYDFCRPVRALEVKDDRGHEQARGPAMAAGLADHVRTMAARSSMPAVRRC